MWFLSVFYGKIVTLARDSSLHHVSLRMTDNCVFGDGVVGGGAANYPILT
jgi:hypothetical protein